MAIGLGAMFGFEFPENFTLPLRRAESIKDFWRRWHMSLSRWFRDYLYMPLGGNRGPPAGPTSTWCTVFFLCGLWHGANWNFVVWGLYHGAFLVLERSSPGLTKERASAAARADPAMYVLLAVIVGWVFFRADDLRHAVGFFEVNGWPGAWASHRRSAHGGYLDPQTLLAIVLWAWRDRRRPSRVWRERSMAARSRSRHPGARRAPLDVCSMFMAARSYNPFIYFRFWAAHARQADDRHIHDDAAGAARGLRRGFWVQGRRSSMRIACTRSRFSCP